MVNWVEALEPLRNFLVRTAGLRPRTVEVSPGTRLRLWGPKKRREDKPAVVLVHGFAGEGISTWKLQVSSLTGRYDVYVPDLLFFGGSTTCSRERSPGFQAECLGLALDALGVLRCTVVGFSYGGFVAFKLAAARPALVEAMVVTGSVIAVTESIRREMLERLGFSSFREMLMPGSVGGLKAFLSVSMYRKIWLPDCLYKDILQAAFSYSDEKAELLEGLGVSDPQEGLEFASSNDFPQRILLLWGEEDRIFRVDEANDIKQRCGKQVSFQAIKKAGHFVQLERPCAYNFHLKKFLRGVHSK